MKKLFLFIVFIVIKLSAQNDFGTWNVTNINLKIADKWNVFTEAQLRSLSFYDQFHYYEYKGGFTYKITSNFSATTGVGSYNTYSEGSNFELPMQNKEIRSWIQINMKNPLERITFEHRYRAGETTGSSI